MTRASQRIFPGMNSREAHWQIDDTSQQWQLDLIRARGASPAASRIAKTRKKKCLAEEDQDPAGAMAVASNHDWASGPEPKATSQPRALSHTTFNYSSSPHPATLPPSTQSPSGVIWSPEVCQSAPSLGLLYNTCTAALPRPGVAAFAPSGNLSASVPQDGRISSVDLHNSSTATSTWLHDNQWAAGFFTDSSGVDNSHSLPPRLPPNQGPPTIRLTTATAASQPQAAYLSASASPPAGRDNNHIPAFLSHPHSQMSPYMANETMEPIQAPVSPISPRQSPHDTTMGDQQHQLPRKRSHSVMSQQHDAAIVDVLHSRAPSTHSQTGASPTEEFSPRGSRAFKRGDPPMNTEGKYICNFSDDCNGQVFERKCEWSKHMDKHDRPYRCPHPSCAKLQGFTYSGGLLRHEREVHNKHGGPKAQLVCPFTDCKRHSGKGFTRKENLNEHLRRVHNNKDASSQQDAILEPNGNEVVPGALDGETQASTMTTTGGEDLSSLEPSLKRKRSNPPQDQVGLSALDENNMMQEMHRLRQENAWQADRIRQLEAAAAMNAEKTQRLEETISLWAQQQSQAHAQHEQQQQPEQPLMQHHEPDQQQFAPQHEESQNNEHQQLAEQQIAEHHLTEQHLSDQQLGEQQLGQHGTVEGDMKAVFEAVHAEGS
ncbi:unnamed protein product [Cercospora beticola]|nr:unnamed protein product [Cercospora beticola]